MNVDRSVKEQRYLALIKLFDKVIKPEVEKLVDDENGGFDIDKLKSQTNNKTLQGRLSCLSEAFINKAIEIFGKFAKTNF